MSTSNGYQNAYRRAAVGTMDQNKLIVMLYDGAIRHIKMALKHMATGKIEEVHNSLVRSKNIVSELMVSLNMEKGGEIAKNLRSLYTYIFGQLIEANMHKKSAPAEDALVLLQQLREAWMQISQTGEPAPKPAPAPGDPVKRINLKG